MVFVQKCIDKRLYSGCFVGCIFGKLKRTGFARQAAAVDLFLCPDVAQ